MIKYRIKEITYGNGNKQFKVEYQKKYKLFDFIHLFSLLIVKSMLLCFQVIFHLDF
jgi:hypothetical protein